MFNYSQFLYLDIHQQQITQSKSMKFLAMLQQGFFSLSHEADIQPQCQIWTIFPNLKKKIPNFKKKKSQFQEKFRNTGLCTSMSLRNSLGQAKLSNLMRICIGGSVELTEQLLKNSVILSETAQQDKLSCNAE